VVLAAVGVVPVYFLGRVIALDWEDVAATIQKILQ
jgi:asparagine N-glycosylation enzyme membrane subunit Stt3